MQRFRHLLAAAVAVGVACSDPFQPTVENVIGDYTARTLTVTDSSGTRDLLKAGAILTLSLGPRGSAFGYLYIPASAGDAEVVADMAGTWTLWEGVILLDQTAETFVRDMAFFAYDRQLYASKYFSSARVEVVLTK